MMAIVRLGGCQKAAIPFVFRKYWAFLDPAKTYEDRELLKQRGVYLRGKLGMCQKI